MSTFNISTLLAGSYIGNPGATGPAGEWHEIEALEDDTVFVNVFAEGKY